jgi:hypothetical protein
MSTPPRLEASGPLLPRAIPLWPGLLTGPLGPTGGLLLGRRPAVGQRDRVRRPDHNVDRQVRRIEHGMCRATAGALAALAKAHGLDVNAYMDKLAKAMGYPGTAIPETALRRGLPHVVARSPARATWPDRRSPPGQETFGRAA